MSLQRRRRRRMIERFFPSLRSLAATGKGKDDRETFDEQGRKLDQTNS